MRRRVTKSQEERRRELIDAARELFVQKGYEAASVSDIVRRADVAQGTFYLYFASKQEVLAAIWRDLLEELFGIIRSLMERPGLSAVERLRLAWEEVIAHMRPKSRLVEAVFLKANVSLPSQLLEEFNPHLMPVLTGIIEQGRREGDIHVTHPEIAADFLWTVGYRLFERVAQEQMKAEQPPAPGSTGALRDLQDLQDAFWEFVTRGLGVTGGSRH